MAHGQWTEVEARGVVGAWRKSGLSVEKFSVERGINFKRLYYWRKRLEPKPAAPATKALTLLPVSVAEPRRGEPITVLLRCGQMLKVGRGFDEEAFARVVAMLEGS